jgi:large conductance mechanosensitive channel
LKEMIKEFRDFAVKGNVIDLAVGVIIGGAFGKIVTSLVNDIIMPLVGIIIGKVSFADLKIVVTPASANNNELAIYYGKFIQTTFDFLIIAFCIFLFIKVLSKLKQKKEEEEVVTVESAPKTELLLAEIRDLLKENK